MSNTQLCWMIGVPTTTVILTAIDNHRRARQLGAKLDRILEKGYISGVSDHDGFRSREHIEGTAYDTRSHQEFRAVLKTKTN